MEVVRILTGQVVIQIDAETGKVKELKKDLNGLESASTKTNTSFKSLVTSMTAFAIAGKAVNVLKGALDGAISRYDTLTNFAPTMEKMGFSADASAKSVQRLSDGTKGLPTKLNDVVKMTQRLASGNKDLDKSTETVIAMNNAFLASGASASDASRGMEQYVQMLAVGKVDMQAWRSVQETMPYALNKTAEAFGFAGASATNDLYSALKDGVITIDQLNSKFIELNGGVDGFAEVALQARQGIGTAMTNIGTAVTRGVANVITAFDNLASKSGAPNFAQQLNSLTTVIDSTFKKITNFMGGLEGFNLNSLVTNIGFLISAYEGLNFASGLLNSKGFEKFANIGISSFSKIGNAFNSMTSLISNNSLTSILSASAGVFTKIKDTASKSISFIPNSFTAMRNASVGIIQNMSSIFEPIGKFAVNVSNKVPALFSSAFNRLPNFAQTATSKVGSIFDAMGGKIGGVSNVLSDAFSAIGSKISSIGDLGSTVFSAISGQFEGIAHTLNNKLGGAFTIAKNGFSVLGTGFNNAMTQMQANASQLLPNISKIFGDVGSKISPVFNKVGGLVSGAISNTLSGIQKVVALGMKMIMPIAIIGVIIAGLGALDSSMGGAITQIIANVTEKAPQVIMGFANGILSQLPFLMETGVQIVMSIVNLITQNLPLIVEKGMEILKALIFGVTNNSAQLIECIVLLFDTLATTIITLLPQLIILGLQILQNLVNGILENLPLIIETVVNLITLLATTFSENLPQILEMGIQILLSVVDGIMQALPELIPAIVQAVLTIVQALIDNFDKIIDGAMQLVDALVDGIIQNLPTLLDGAVQIILAIVQGIVENLPKLIEMGFELVRKLAGAILQMLPDLIDAGWDLVKGLADGIWKGITGALQAAIDGIWNTITGALGGVGDFIGGLFGGGSSRMLDVGVTPQTQTQTYSNTGQDLGLSRATQTQMITPLNNASFSKLSTPNIFKNFDSKINANADMNVSTSITVKNEQDTNILNMLSEKLNKAVDNLQAIKDKKSDVLLDGKKVGTIIEPTVTKKQQSNTGLAKAGVRNV